MPLIIWDMQRGLQDMWAKARAPKTWESTIGATPRRQD